MERVGTLINKLKEQYEQQADAEKLSVTVQLILAELQHVQKAAVSKGKVSVVLPSYVAPAVIVTQATTTPPPAKPVAVKKEPAPAAWAMEEPAGIPTMVHQPQEKKEVYELNDVMVAEKESLNEKLKEDRMEVATLLQGAPIRDLKKAIGVNDRYIFVNDLFRGDENMFERSMKTINAFNIYPEAQYWIQRELKVKMGWNDNSEAVKLFDQLIKRRFS